MQKTSFYHHIQKWVCTICWVVILESSLIKKFRNCKKIVVDLSKWIYKKTILTTILTICARCPTMTYYVFSIDWWFEIWCSLVLRWCFKKIFDKGEAMGTGHACRWKKLLRKSNTHSKHSRIGDSYKLKNKAKIYLMNKSMRHFWLFSILLISAIYLQKAILIIWNFYNRIC